MTVCLRGQPLLLGCMLSALLLCGCASTQQYERMAADIPHNANEAIIRIHRTKSSVGSGSQIHIHNGDIPIGILGIGGELAWVAPPGLVPVVANVVFPHNALSTVHPNAGIVIRVDAGQCYDLTADFRFGGSVRLTGSNPTSQPVALVGSGQLDAQMAKLDPNWTVQRQPDPVLVFPILDLRQDKSLSFDTLGGTHDRTNRPIGSAWMAKNRQCEIQNAGEIGLALNVSIGDLENGNRVALQSLPSRGQRFALILCLHELHEFAGGGAKATVSGYLVDIRRGSVIWRNRVERKVWVGVLMGAITGDGRAEQAFQDAVDALLFTFPVMRQSSQMTHHDH